jgi:hypothetical protein
VYLDFLESFLRDRGILEQNQEISGPKEQVFPRFADPGDGTLNTTPMMMAGMPRFIRGNYRPGGVFGSPPPNLDSPFMDERIKRGFVPMTPPLPRGAGGPQLPGFV